MNVTTGMIYGTPPIDAFSSASDPGDLPTHGMFPTYYNEVPFSFSSGSQSAAFNTQDHPSWGPQSGSGMYYKRFDIDTSNLASDYEVHFDLYNTKLCTNSKGQCGDTIHTTNGVESLNMGLRRVTKNRGSFPSDEAVLKHFYLAIRKISRS